MFWVVQKMLMKKRKLNSKNPRYLKIEQEDVDKKLIKEVKGAKIYAIFKK
tara:strand:- start:35 stop:184 length:150 start_codon:yes stop_codon:yes gene_type:complete